MKNVTIPIGFDIVSVPEPQFRRIQAKILHHGRLTATEIQLVDAAISWVCNMESLETRNTVEWQGVEQT